MVVRRSVTGSFGVFGGPGRHTSSTVDTRSARLYSAEMAALDGVKLQQSHTWSLGDYSSIGSRLSVVSEQLCETADLRAPWTVLDLATGPGTTALAAARRGCRVTGVDISEALLGRARARAAAEGLAVYFGHEDAENLPFETGSFDAVMSTFGIGFTPSPEAAAREAMRVLRPGGRLALTHWAPGGANRAEEEVIARFDEAGPPSPWASESGIRALFGSDVSDLVVTERDVVYRFDSIGHFVDTAMTRFGPFMRLVESLSEEDRDRLRTEMVAALGPFNRSGDESMVMPVPYLEVTATRR